MFSIWARTFQFSISVLFQCSSTREKGYFTGTFIFTPLLCHAISKIPREELYMQNLTGKTETAKVT